MSTTQIALLTHTGLPEPTRDDQLLADALRDTVRVESVPWDAPDAVDRLAEVDAVVIRSTWNYTEQLPSFLAFVGALERNDAPLLNPASVVRWNCDKHYLDELQRAGIATLPTVFVARGDGLDLPDLMDRHGWRDAVVKPTVSATAKGLFRVGRDEAAAQQGRLDAALRTTDLMVQPVAPEIERDGEWSLTFFGGRFSHAVRKRAARGDFRVQGDFGGRAEADNAPTTLIADAEYLLEQIHTRFADAAPLLYARVDGIERDGRLVLMELELIEPELFFRCEPEAAGRCVQTLLERI